MLKEKPFAVVLFAEHIAGNMPLHQRLLSRLIQVCSLSRIVHCAIAYDGVVLDARFGGNVYWPAHQVWRWYPGLFAVVRADFLHRIDLGYFEYGVAVRKPIFPTVWRTLAYQTALTDDCLCVVLACLRAGGVPAPTTTKTPAGLLRWLIRRGYPHATRGSNRNNGAEAFRDAARLCITHPGAG